MYGLIGKSLAHSFSGNYFKNKFASENIQAEYHHFELQDINSFPDFLFNHPQLKGLNITIPYKEQIIPYLDQLQDNAAEIGAVNCIDIKDGILTGYNTDYTGFMETIRPYGWLLNEQAILLGTGGASRAVAYALSQLGIKYLLVSTSQLNETTIHYNMLNEEIINRHKLIINTTPLGTFPNTDAAPPIPYRYLTPGHFLYDLTYNPEISKFLQYGKDKDAHTLNGYQMLVNQAEESWKIWNK